jgi:hypothetical protein
MESPHGVKSSTSRRSLDAPEVGSASLQPENQEAWSSATKELLGKAMTDTSELFAALGEAEPHLPDSPKLAMKGSDIGPRRKADLDDKLHITKFAINTVETASQRTSQALHRLQHERQKKWAGLKVVEWRVELRQRRPAQELFADHLQDALEAEKTAIERGRELLAKQIDQGKTLFEDCEANRARLVRNSRYMTSYHTTRVPPYPATQDPGEAEPTSPSGNEVKQSLSRVPQLAEIASQYAKTSDKLIQRERKICSAANEKSMACFQKRWDENEDMKKSLEQHIGELENSITAAEKSMAKMKKRIDHYGEDHLQPKYDNVDGIVQKLRQSKVELDSRRDSLGCSL